MIFKPDLLAAIRRGEKDTTRRIQKLLETFSPYDGRDRVVSWAQAGKIVTKWEVGRTYAIVPGRGKPAAWWNPATGELLEYDWQPEHRAELAAKGWQREAIKVTELWSARLHTMTDEDAVHEGTKNLAEFQVLWNTINGSDAWNLNPLVWIIKFEYVGPALVRAA